IPARPATPNPSRVIEQATRDLATLQTGHDYLLGQIRAFDPTYNPDRCVPPIHFDQVPSLIPRDVPTAIVHYTLMAERGLILVITADDIQAVPLPGFNANQATAPANAWYRAYYEECREPPDDQGRRKLSFRAWCDRIEGLLNPVAQHAVW